MNFFKDCTTVEQVKKLYRELALRWHPDRPGGDTETMQQVNAAYAAALKGLDGQASRSDAGDAYTYHYDEAREEAVMAKIAEVIRSGILDAGVEVYLIGTWLWAVGETKPHRQTLGREGLGFTWNSNKLAWCWHEGAWYKRSSKGSLADIAARYGASKVEAQARDEEARDVRGAKSRQTRPTPRKRIKA